MTLFASLFVVFFLYTVHKSTPKPQVERLDVFISHLKALKGHGLQMSGIGSWDWSARVFIVIKKENT